MSIDSRSDSGAPPTNTSNLTLINTNARSLYPKLNSLLDCMNEVDAKIAAVTETWMGEGRDLERMVQDLSLGSGVGILMRNRHRNGRGVAHGGVAVLWKEGMGDMKRVKLTLRNDNDY